MNPAASLCPTLRGSSDRRGRWWSAFPSAFFRARVHLARRGSSRRPKEPDHARGLGDWGPVTDAKQRPGFPSPLPLQSRRTSSRSRLKLKLVLACSPYVSVVAAVSAAMVCANAGGTLAATVKTRDRGLRFFRREPAEREREDSAAKLIRRTTMRRVGRCRVTAEQQLA